MKATPYRNKLFFEGLLLIFFILTVGTMNLFSALSYEHGLSFIFYKHLIWLLVGVIIAMLVQALNPADIENLSPLLYVICCFLLFLVLIAGKKVNGAQRWFAIGPLTFQPSELMKLALIFFIARHFRYMPACEGGYRFRHLRVPLLIMLVPVFLILKEPDLGTAIIVITITLSMILLLGVNIRLLIGSIAAFIISLPFIWMFLLKDYQKQRITSFLFPESDPMGSGYHALQAKIAVGTGGFLGKGYMKGTQSKLGFIPEKHTDFAFSVFSEEWGFLGVSIFIILFAYLIYWMFRVIRNLQDRFLFLSGAGVMMLFSIHFFVNVAMVGGLFPVVGVPLPLLSYGGTALLINMAGMSYMLRLARMHA